MLVLFLINTDALYLFLRVLKVEFLMVMNVFLYTKAVCLTHTQHVLKHRPWSVFRPRIRGELKVYKHFSI